MSKMDKYDNIFNNEGTSSVTSSNYVIKDYENNKITYREMPDLVNFYKNYSERLNYSNYNDHHFIGEKVNEKNCPLFDIFKFYTKCSKCEYERAFITSIVKVYQSVISEIIDVSKNCAELGVIVFSRKPYKHNKRFIIEIKIQAPYCRITKKIKEEVFNPLLLKMLKNIRIDNFFGDEYIKKSWEISMSEFPSFVSLYGSHEESLGLITPPRTFIPKNNGEEIITEIKKPFEILGVYGKKLKSVELSKQFDYSDHPVIDEMDSSEDLTDLLNECDDSSNLLLPYISSMYFSDQDLSHLKISNEEEYINEDENLDEETIINLEESEQARDNPSNFQILKILIEYLKDFRFEEKIYFDEIGKAIYNSTSVIENGYEIGLKLWKNFSKRGEISEEYCDERYPYFEGTGVSVKTVAWYAKEDNLKKYKKWHEEWSSCKIKYSISNHEHLPVAEAFYRCFWLDFMIGDKVWYQFTGNRLIKKKENTFLKKFITERFIPIIDKYQEVINRDLSTSRSNKRKSAEGDGLLNDARKLLSNLKKDPYRKSIVNVLKEYFHCENIDDYMNKNNDLLGLTNCVIETNDEGIYIRQGKPEDFVSKSMGVTYDFKMNKNHPTVKKTLLYLRMVFAEPTLFEFMKRDVSSMLRGENLEKLFRMWVGETNGSKSIYLKIIEKMFGDYYKNLPDEYYSAKQKNSNGLDPATAQLAGSRVAGSSEPDDDNKFKGARIKKITGGDSFFTRGCGSDGGTVASSFKTIMALNIVPHITGVDGATLERFLMIPFEGTWYNLEDIKLPDDIEEQIKLKSYYKKNMTKEIPLLAKGLLWIAVNNYDVYLEKGLEKPDYIRQWMKNYWETHDPIMEFMEEKIEIKYIDLPCDDCDDQEEGDICLFCKNTKVIKNKKRDPCAELKITNSKLYRIYGKWLRDSHPEITLCGSEKFGDIMKGKEKLGPQTKKSWNGIYIVPDEDEMFM